MAARRQRAGPAPSPANAGPAALERKKKKAAAAAVGRPDARKRRSMVDIYNQESAPAVDGKAKLPEGINRPITRSFSKIAQANAAVASKNAIAPAQLFASKPARRATKVGGTSSDESMEPSTGAGTRVKRTRNDAVGSLMARVIEAEFEADTEKKVRIAEEEIKRKDSMLSKLFRIAVLLARRSDKLENICGRLFAQNARLLSDACQKTAEVLEVIAKKEAEVQKVKAEKEAEVHKLKAQKEAEVQKLLEENIRLQAMVDKKEAQLQAMSEQCKFMALNHPN
ncbi:hypothetical protein ACP70R_043676 [Stipagrostis hirtigluma subsp. patula]